MFYFLYLLFYLIYFFYHRKKLTNETKTTALNWSFSNWLTAINYVIIYTLFLKKLRKINKTRDFHASALECNIYNLIIHCIISSWSYIILYMHIYIYSYNFNITCIQDYILAIPTYAKCLYIYIDIYICCHTDTVKTYSKY